MRIILIVIVAFLLLCSITSAQPPVSFAEINPGEVCQFWHGGRTYPVVFYDAPFMGEWSFYGQTPPSGGIGIFNMRDELVAVTREYVAKDGFAAAGVAIPMIQSSIGILDTPVAAVVKPPEKVPSFVIQDTPKKEECPPSG